MELRNLNNTSIYIVPLLDDNLTWKDLTVESGYVNAFTTDKNRPYFEDKVFLVYRSDCNTSEALERYLKFNHLNTIHNTKYITINNIHYTVYCFNRTQYKKDIDNLQLNGKVKNINAALEINRFWNNVPVPELAQRLFLDSYRFGDKITAELPEEDYYSYEDIGESL